MLNLVDDDLLAEDVMEEVMLRLPVKSLLRFRCVSKGWCALIDSHAFSMNHFQTKSNNTTQIHHDLVFVTGFGPMAAARFYSFKGLHSSLAQISLQHFLPPITRPYLRSAHLLGSFNGLLCIQLCYDSPRIMIWNNTTRKHLILPVQPFSYFFASGFGYDSVSDDYKVVVMVEDGSGYIYTVKSNSWRKLEDGNSHKYPIYNYLQSRGSLACSVLHWVSEERDPHGAEYVIGFDLATETRGLIVTLPDFRDGDNDRVQSLVASELGGCLSIVCKHSWMVGVFDVWVMKDYGVRESWIKLLTLSGSEIDVMEFLFPLAYSESGDEVLLRLHFRMSKRLIWFNIENKIVKLVDVPENMYIQPVICFESLVSLGDRAEND